MARHGPGATRRQADGTRNPVVVGTARHLTPAQLGEQSAGVEMDADQFRMIGDPGEKDLGVRQPCARCSEWVAIDAAVARVLLARRQRALEAGETVEDGHADAAGLLLLAPGSRVFHRSAAK